MLACDSPPAVLGELRILVSALFASRLFMTGDEVLTEHLLSHLENSGLGLGESGASLFECAWILLCKNLSLIVPCWGIVFGTFRLGDVPCQHSRKHSLAIFF